MALWPLEQASQARLQLACKLPWPEMPRRPKQTSHRHRGRAFHAPAREAAAPRGPGVHRCESGRRVNILGRMDYRKQSTAFKIRKVLRYTRLYGPRRTWLKVKSQSHMARRYESLPALASPPPPGGHVGMVGSGNFAFSTLAYFVRKNYGPVIRASMDHGLHRAASLFEEYGLRYYTDDASRLLADPEIDLVFVATNHASHAEYAIQALEAGKNVHIEKPHVVDDEQRVRLCRAMVETGGKVSLGFNRPCSRMFEVLKRHFDRQSGASMLNWFIVTHPLPDDHWYLRPGEGGRVLGNLCHWTDFVYRMVPPEARYPITIVPARFEDPGRDVAVSLTFGDGTIAALTFSERGETYEGVRETFSAQRGDALMFLKDFQDARVEVFDKKYRLATLFRDQGHEARVRLSYEMVRPGRPANPGATVEYVWETAELFLKTKLALDRDERVVVQPFSPERLDAPVEAASPGSR